MWLASGPADHELPPISRHFCSRRRGRASVPHRFAARLVRTYKSGEELENGNWFTDKLVPGIIGRASCCSSCCGSIARRAVGRWSACSAASVRRSSTTPLRKFRRRPARRALPASAGAVGARQVPAGERATRATRVTPARRARQAPLAPKVMSAPPAPRVTQVPRVLPDQRAIPARPVRLALPGQPVLPVQLARPALRAPPVRRPRRRRKGALSSLRPRHWRGLFVTALFYRRRPESQPANPKRSTNGAGDAAGALPFGRSAYGRRSAASQRSSAASSLSAKA